MTSASDNAYAALKALIQKSEISPGQSIDEAEVAQRFGVSRTPVREALLRLQSDGFVEIGRGKGIRVLPLSSAEMRETYQVISGLEVAAVALIAKMRPSVEDLECLSAATRAMSETLADQDVDAWGEADERFHRGLLKLSGNGKLFDIGCQMRDLVLRAHRVAVRLQTPEYRAGSTANHADLIAALIAHPEDVSPLKHYTQRLRGENALVGIVDRFKLKNL